MPRFYDEFPYTNTTDINLDWIIEVIRDIDQRVTALEEQVDAINTWIYEHGGD